MGRTKELTQKQAAFRDAILAGFNPSEAYKKAFNAKGESPKSISNNAQKLLKNPKIALAISLATKSVVRFDVKPPIPEAVRCSLETRLERLRAAIDLDPAEYFDDLNHFLPIKEMPKHVRMAIAGFKVDPVSFVLEVKFVDRVSAIMNYSKLAGDIPPQEKGGGSLPPPPPREIDTSQWTEKDWEDFRRLRTLSKPVKVVNGSS